MYTGGAEYSTLLFYQWLQKKDGFAIEFLYLKEAEPSYDPAVFEIQEIRKLSGNSNWQRFKQLKEEIKGFRPNIVHSILFQANILTRFTRFFDHSFIHLESLVNEMYSKHRLQETSVTKTKLIGYRFFDWLTQLFGVDHFHANGASVASHYQQMLWISKSRITVIPRGRNQNIYVNDDVNRISKRNEIGIGEKLCFIHVGRHEYQKGQDVLLKAFALLPDQLRNEIVLVLVGRAGKLTKQIYSLIENKPWQNKVIITGHRDDVQQLLACADIFVFPSRFEGLPGALIEAAAAGLPVICSDIPNNLEVVDRNINAFVHKVNDANQLADLMSMLIKDPAGRAAMGRASLKVFKERFELEYIHRSMLSMIQDLSTK